MSSKGSSTTRPIASSVHLRESACVSSAAPASHDFYHPRQCFVNQPRAPIDSPQFVDNWMQLRRTWHCLLSSTDNPASSIPSPVRPAASVLHGQGRCWACCHRQGVSAVVWFKPVSPPALGIEGKRVPIYNQEQQGSRQPPAPALQACFSNSRSSSCCSQCESLSLRFGYDRPRPHTIRQSATKEAIRAPKT